jgi:hypothetical protein
MDEEMRLWIISIMVKPIDRLVSVCSIPYGTYTSDLSTL